MCAYDDTNIPCHNNEGYKENINIGLHLVLQFVPHGRSADFVGVWVIGVQSDGSLPSNHTTGADCGETTSTTVDAGDASYDCRSYAGFGSQDCGNAGCGDVRSSSCGGYPDLAPTCSSMNSSTGKSGSGRTPTSGTRPTTGPRPWKPSAKARATARTSSLPNTLPCR